MKLKKQHFYSRKLKSQIPFFLNQLKPIIKKKIYNSTVILTSELRTAARVPTILWHRAATWGAEGGGRGWWACWWCQRWWTPQCRRAPELPVACDPLAVSSPRGNSLAVAGEADLLACTCGERGRRRAQEKPARQSGANWIEPCLCVQRSQCDVASAAGMTSVVAARGLVRSASPSVRKLLPRILPSIFKGVC